MKNQAWIGHLASYNEGKLIGKWIDFPINEDDAREIYENIRQTALSFGMIGEEFFIGDSEMPFKVGEFESLLTINEKYEMIQNFSEDQILVLHEILDDTHNASFEYAVEIAKSSKWEIYRCNHFTDVAIEYVIRHGILDEYDDFVAEYFDYEKYASLIQDTYTLYEPKHGVYILVNYVS